MALQPELTVMVPMSFTSTIAVIGTLNLVLAAPPLDRSFRSYLDGTQAELIRHNHGKCKQRCVDCFSQGAIRTCTSPLSHPLLPVVYYVGHTQRKMLNPAKCVLIPANFVATGPNNIRRFRVTWRNFMLLQNAMAKKRTKEYCSISKELWRRKQPASPVSGR